MMTNRFYERIQESCLSYLLIFQCLLVAHALFAAYQTVNTN